MGQSSINVDIVSGMSLADESLWYLVRIWSETTFRIGISRPPRIQESQFSTEARNRRPRLPAGPPYNRPLRLG